MATVLLTWELGSGLGHVANLAPVALRLADRGHRVIVAMPETANGRTVFPDNRIEIIAAPLRDKSGPRIEPNCTFAQLLFNVGFGSADELRRITSLWRRLFLETQPELVLFEHSPVGMLAARGLPFRKAAVGSGFFHPLDQTPLPNLRPWINVDAHRLASDEQLVLDNMNRQLAACNQPPLRRVTELYQSFDEQFLATFPELDVYPKRRNVRYWGCWSILHGAPANWPEGSGPKIFAYLKPFASFDTLLTRLHELGHVTLVFAPLISAQTRDRFTTSRLTFVDEPLSISAVRQDCDLAIVNGSPGTVTNLLLGGVPVLQIPLYLEQLMFSRAVYQLGAGLVAAPDLVESVVSCLDEMLGCDRFAVAAKKFATYYADYDPDYQLDRIAEHCERLIRNPVCSGRPRLLHGAGA